MLFSSYLFLFAYLPVVLLGFFWIARLNIRWAAAWLAASSLFFYGWWNPPYVLLLLASVTFNFAAGRLLARQANRGRRKWMLPAAIAANLGLLGYYKYANFFVGTANELLGWHLPLRDVLLPLGISFFTFTQIAFLVDVHRGIAKETQLVHYVLFVTYFPHLIAGPVLHHRQMMPQFAKPEIYGFSSSKFALGLAMLSLGLAKKVLLADSLADYANAVFDGAAPGFQPKLGTAWTGALAYTLQLYFDFSGYSDMAIGLSLMFNIKLPINFNSPYKSTSIIEFWRRWHMTLSQFLRDYLYIALGGNRGGTWRRYVNLMLTMVLGGLWHGANWTFVAWGTVHGAFLVINHGWLAMKPRLPWVHVVPQRLRTLAAGGLTFACVLLAWVLFRAESFATAWAILRGMLGLNGVSLPSWLRIDVVRALTWRFGNWQFDGLFFGNEKLQALGVVPFVCMASLALFIVWLFPNSQQLLGYSAGTSAEDAPRAQAAWTPRTWSAITIALLFGLSVVSFSKSSPFLYFQF